MEIIVGREEGARRLHCTVDGRNFYVGAAGSVPLSVSRKHCRITVNDSTILIENLKPENVTFADDCQIFSKEIKAESKVQLGNEKFTLPLQQIISLTSGTVRVVPGGDAGTGGQGAGLGHGPGKEVQVFSLKPLESVWEEYDRRKLEIQEAAAKTANMSRLQGILSMSGMCIGFIPSIDQTLRILIIVVALLIAVYFFFQGMRTDSVQKQLRDLDLEFTDKYKCPNPNCGKPFGSAPYHQIKFNRQCFSCGCKYTN